MTQKEQYETLMTSVRNAVCSIPWHESKDEYILFMPEKYIDLVRAEFETWLSFTGNRKIETWFGVKLLPGDKPMLVKHIPSEIDFMEELK